MKNINVICDQENLLPRPTAKSVA